MKSNTQNTINYQVMRRRCDTSIGKSRGFTIVELMITLTVAAILLAIAIPSFTYLTVSSRLTATANELVSRLSLARSDAIKQNAMINIATDGAVTVVASGDVLSPAITLPSAVTYTSAQALNANPMGMLLAAGANAGYTGLVGDFGSTKISTNNHRCVYVITGATVTSCTDSAACGGGAPSATCK
jgi:type IV fimbrial biogenesis protein FimT